ncbi:Divergent paired-related homeobox [Manis javanica]|nr:Divergent paired-related homeobox [Manis javanica]
MFTEKQLADLRVQFRKNPYPTSSLQKETASRMGIHPTTLLVVWFKNHRAKLKKAKYKHIQQYRDAEQQQLAGAGVTTSSFKSDMDVPPRSPTSTSPAPLVYTDHPTPSSQLHICPNIKASTDHSVGHKLVHFGCCQDPNIYCHHSILEPQVFPTSFNSDSCGYSSPQII